MAKEMNETSDTCLLLGGCAGAGDWSATVQDVHDEYAETKQHACSGSSNSLAAEMSRASG